MTSIARRPVLGACVLALLIAPSVFNVGGCASYVNYPEVGQDSAINDANHPPIPDVMAAALKYAAERFPAGGEFVVNLPPGMQLRWAERVVKRMENDSARLVSPGTEHLPAYHVTQVWIRGDAATVEVVRPIPGLKPGSEGISQDFSYQALRMKLRGSFGNSWRVRSTRAWTMGAAEPPRLYGWAAESAAGTTR